MRRVWLAAMLLACPLTRANPPPDLHQIRYEQRLGNQLPLSAPLRDERGRESSFGQLLEGAPLVLDLGYFGCVSLCSLTRDNLLQALGESGLKAGRDYTLVALSIDPNENAATAAAAKAANWARFPLAGAAQGWHFLTAPASSIDQIATAAGFHYRFDPAEQQFLHPAGVVIVSPRGTVSSYLLGVAYAPAALRSALEQASRGAIAAPSLPIRLLCYHFDASTGRYTPSVIKLLRLAGLITLAGMLTLFWLLWRSGRVRSTS